MKPAHAVQSNRSRSALGADTDAPATDHPLRSIKERAQSALHSLTHELAELHAHRAPPSVKLEWVFYGQLLIALYGITSDRAFCARLDTTPSFRWFLEMQPDDATPDWWEFARERRRLADSIIGRCFFNAVLTSASSDGSLYGADFAINGELIRMLVPLDCARHSDKDAVVC
jgi:transposase